ncbi:SDR family oxidoreductase [Streptomyces sp. KL2]|uniref:SDR family oxidoreductase n=1 Tax=Streptomyces sp. KL2 TaxID=3050126 RepID=UPI00397D9955
MARLLADRGHAVRGLARRPGAGAAPTSAAVDYVSCDLGAADEVRRAFEGVTHASVVMPLVYDSETVLRYARNIADAAREAGVERLVYNVNTPLPKETTAYAAFETRRAAESVLRESGVPTVVLRPPVYLDNLFSPWNGPALVNDGVLAYPLPAGQPVAWMSHGDLAAATAAAMEGEDLAGQVIGVGGAEVVTGPELAEAFSSALGREVSYQQLDVDHFEAGLAQLLGAESAAGVAGIYRYAADGGDPDLLAPDPTGVEHTLGIRLIPIVEWVKAQPWEHWAVKNTG